MLTIAGGASRDVASNATASSVLSLLVLLIASALGAWWLTRRAATARGPVAWFSGFASIAGCVSLTLARDGPPQRFRPGEVLAWTVSGWDRLVDGALVASSQFILNAALFVPAGVVWTWLIARPLRTLAGLVGLAMAIESLQSVTGVGAADVADVAANSIGAALGVGGAAIAMLALERTGRSTSASANPRRQAFVAAGVVVVLITGWTALLAGADRRQARIHNELEQVFSDTSYEDIATVLLGDPDDSDRFVVDPRFTDSEQIFGAISVRADGVRHSDQQIEVRWPAVFFGFRRCVYVIWSPMGLRLRDLSGEACTVFIG